MTLTKPLMNNALIEVLKDDDGVSRTDESESLKFGKLIDISISQYHITASSFGELSEEFRLSVEKRLTPGIIVRWEEFAEGGQTFEDGGKTYALIPWWRLISYEEGEL